MTRFQKVFLKKGHALLGIVDFNMSQQTSIKH